MLNKEIKKKRMVSYFIDAAQQIIAKDDFEGITLRNVADLAGYNSATLYNYFKDLDHLLLFASLKYLKSYTLECVEKLPKIKSKKEKFFEMWKIFCSASCEHPKAFYNLFFNKHSELLDELVTEYYSFFPEDIVTEDEITHKVLLNGDLLTRNKIILKEFFLEENIEMKDIDLINEMIIAIYHDLLYKKIKLNGSYNNCNLFVDKMIEYIVFLIPTPTK